MTKSINLHARTVKTNTEHLPLKIIKQLMKKDLSKAIKKMMKDKLMKKCRILILIH